MELLIRIIGIITPVLIISAFGYAYARLRQPDMTSINRLSTDLLYPLLIYTAMASRDFHILDYLPLILGAGGMFLVAAGIEAFWSPSRVIPDSIKLGVGAVLWIMVLGYLTLGGRAQNAR